MFDWPSRSLPNSAGSNAESEDSRGCKLLPEILETSPFYTLTPELPLPAVFRSSCRV